MGTWAAAAWGTWCSMSCRSYNNDYNNGHTVRVSAPRLTPGECPVQCSAVVGGGQCRGGLQRGVLGREGTGDEAPPPLGR